MKKNIFCLLLLNLTLTLHSNQSMAQTSIGPRCQSVNPLSAVASAPVADFKEAATNLIHRLLANGYRKFGELDLNHFLTEITQTNVNYVPALKFSQADGSERSSACWALINGHRSVNVSLWMWARTDSDERSVIAIHEFLGPAGFDDQNYQLSSAMAALATNEAAGLLEPEQIPALSHLSRSTLLASNGGGIVGVGGGGDWLGAMAKLVFFKVGMDDLRRAKTPQERQQAIKEMLEFDNEFTVEVQWH